MTIFLAEDLTLGEATPIDDERIEVRRFAKKELSEMINSGKIDDRKPSSGFCAGKQRSCRQEMIASSGI